MNESVFICVYLGYMIITHVHFPMQVNEHLRELLAQEQRVRDTGEPCMVQKVRRSSLQH